MENIDDKLEVLAESVGAINERLIRVEETVSAIPQMANDVKTVKVAITDHSKHQYKLEARVANLETMPSRA